MGAACNKHEPVGGYGRKIKPSDNPFQERIHRQSIVESIEHFEISDTRKLITMTSDSDYQINQSVLEHFVDIQTEIDVYERDGVFERLRACEEELEVLEKAKRQTEINHKVLEEQARKEKQDFDNISKPSVKSFFQNRQHYDVAVSKEQREYMESLSQLEAAEAELRAATEQYDTGKRRLETFKLDNERAIECYNEQMSILYSTFEGDFGSDHENVLEAEVKQVGVLKEQLRSALHKWTNARFLLVYAYNQIQAAEQSWMEMMKLEFNNTQKVIFATEVRNNLVAARQNLLNTTSYLNNISLPYCTDDDLNTLKNVAAGTYQDMMVVERQNYVLNILQVLRKRCAALNQWFNQVIKDTLIVDFTKAKTDYNEKFKALKMERIRLLEVKIKEKTGRDIKVNLLGIQNESLTAHHSQDEKSEMRDELQKTELNPKLEIHETSVASYELPPPPSKEQILGNVKKIEQQYRRQKTDWNNFMDTSKRDADERLNQMLAQFQKKTSVTRGPASDAAPAETPVASVAGPRKKK